MAAGDQDRSVPRVLTDLLGIEGASKWGQSITSSLFSGISRLYDDWLVVPLAERKAKAHLIISEAEAGAEAKRALILAGLEQAKTVKGRALLQHIHDLERHQANLEGVASYALEEVRLQEATGEGCDDPQLDSDWVEEFRELAKKANKEDLQRLLGKILAQEAASPGRYPISVVFKLKLLDADTLQAFQSFANLFVPGFGIIRTFLLQGAGDAEAKRLGLSFHDLTMCANEGLMLGRTDIRMSAAELDEFEIEINDQAYELKPKSLGVAVPVLGFTSAGATIAGLMSRRADEKYVSDALKLLEDAGFAVRRLR